MPDQWCNPDFAENWNRTTLEGNPTRAEQLDILLSIVEKEYQAGKTILDLGMGSGQVEEMLFSRRAEIDVVGVDYSPIMIELAQQRLRSCSEQCTIIQHDFSNIAGLSLPDREYQIAISIQALHHMSHQNKKELSKYVYDTLEAGGIFLLMDRIAIDTAHLSSLYTILWNRLESLTNVKSGWSAEDFLQRLQNKEDHPASVEEHLDWLRSTGFHAACLHLHLDRAVIGGIKNRT